ncbi:MAG: flagellar basal-body rod protein FlgF [Alphaproteobacteria bacterium]
MTENTAYIALSQQMALRREMELIANNLANMNTTAYRSKRMVFEEVLSEIGADQQVSFVQDAYVVPSLDEGTQQRTDARLDMAISGPGFFVVQGEDGPRYTRNGHFRADADGRLVTDTGLPVLDDAGAPISVGTNPQDILIRADGTVSDRNGPIGRLSLVEFDNEYSLTPVGNSLFRTDDVAQPADDARVTQGFIEGSNVKPVLEMTHMTEVLRAYQTTAQLIESDKEIRLRAIRTLGASA